MKKALLRMIAAFLMICSLTVRVNAAGAGTVSDPIKMADGKLYTAVWTQNSYSNAPDIYNRIRLTVNGFIDLRISKPVGVQGRKGSFIISVADIRGNEMFQIDTYPKRADSAKEYTYRIGLNAGSYLIRLTPKYLYFNTSKYKSLSATYSYSFTRSGAFEAEPNNTKEFATRLKLGTVCTGVYTDESYSGKYGYSDYYSIQMVKGRYYRIKLDNWTELSNTTTVFRVLKPSGGESKKLSLFYSKGSGTLRYWDYLAEETGTYYFEFSHAGWKKGITYKLGVLASTKEAAPLTENPKNKWKKIGTKWYYYDADGWIKTGWLKQAGKWYYLGPDGAMLTGWQKINKKWYYLQSSGVMKTGWLKLSGKWYYLDPSGVMVTGSRKIGKKTYNFSSSGVCLNP